MLLWQINNSLWCLYFALFPSYNLFFLLPWARPLGCFFFSFWEVRCSNAKTSEYQASRVTAMFPARSWPGWGQCPGHCQGSPRQRVLLQTCHYSCHSFSSSIKWHFVRRFVYWKGTVWCNSSHVCVCFLVFLPLTKKVKHSCRAKNWDCVLLEVN